MPDSAPDITIIGAGLLGLTSAWFLRAAGLSVRVLERHDDVGLETCYANGGMVTPSMSDPWNAPGIHWQLLRWLGHPDAPMLIRPRTLPDYVAWGLSFLRHSSGARHQVATEANLALSLFSVAELRALLDQHPLDYARGVKGTLKIFRDTAHLHDFQERSQQLHRHGLAFEVLDGAGVARIEPVLAPIARELVGGIHYPHDETGNAWRFACELKRELVASGVELRCGVEVTGLEVQAGRIRAVATRDARLPAQHVVVAAGAWSPALVAPLGLRLNIRPVKGYSLSARLTRPAAMPTLAIIDDSVHASCAPLGDTLRLAGTAEFGGFDRTLYEPRLKALWTFLDGLGPELAGAVDRTSAKAWCGFRPMAADGRAYIGATPVAGLYVNAGHGHLGWTQSVGSGRLLAQLVTGARPGIDPAPYAVGR